MTDKTDFRAAVRYQPGQKLKDIWWVGQERDGRVFIEGPFNPHDVRLYVNGDFANDAECVLYTIGIADALNGAKGKIAQTKELDPQEIEG